MQSQLQDHGQQGGLADTDQRMCTGDGEGIANLPEPAIHATGPVPAHTPGHIAVGGISLPPVTAFDRPPLCGYPIPLTQDPSPIANGEVMYAHSPGLNNPTSNSRSVLCIGLHATKLHWSVRLYKHAPSNTTTHGNIIKASSPLRPNPNPPSGSRRAYHCHSHPSVHHHHRLLLQHPARHPTSLFHPSPSPGTTPRTYPLSGDGVSFMLAVSCCCPTCCSFCLP